MGGRRKDGVAGQDRRRTRAGGRGHGRGLLAGGGAPGVTRGEAQVSVAGGGEEHGGGQDRGRRLAGRGGGREPSGRFHSRGVAEGRRGGDGNTLLQGGGDAQAEARGSSGRVRGDGGAGGGGAGARARGLRFASPRDEVAGRQPGVSQLPTMGYGLMP